MKVADLTPIERRLLAYLDQHGATDRQKIVTDLASPESRAGRGIQNGSNGAAPLIVGKWAKRLIAAAWVTEQRSGGYYQKHEITDLGRRALREAA